MKLLDARVRWWLGWGNSPELELLIDEIPNECDMIFQKLDFDHHTFYWGEKDGLVQFYSYNPCNTKGFGGGIFNLKMEDGTVDRVKGPWSSRSSVMNLYFPHSKEVVLYTSVHKFSNNLPDWGGKVTRNLLIKAAQICGVELKQTNLNGEIHYDIIGKDLWEAKAARLKYDGVKMPDSWDEGRKYEQFVLDYGTR